ncbi:MAG: hypothetical protein A3G20_08590 [Acidobacteria bacterium RIFCSPLOWO2_12_FULL_59_11]|nr:MAG: hypothetical protein A3G20_08590 [Acidobacteria bacterium RIFCSPLOWO2_12_FULL_59_11]
MSKWAKLAAVAFLVLLPFLVVWAYRRTVSALPSEVVIATGPVGGQFFPLMQNLAQEIETKLRIKVTLKDPTNGSMINRLLLQAGEVDFGLYQAGALENTCRLDPTNCEKVRSSLPSGNEEIAFVSNVYLAPVSFIVRRDAGIRSPADLRGKSVRLAPPGNGDYAVSLVLLEHFGLDLQSIVPRYLDYPQLKEAFLNGTLDAAFITFGVQAPIFRDVFESEKVALLGIPNAEAFAASHLSMSPYRIPAGLYHSQFPIAPPTDIQTVAVNAQLLARASTHAGLVEEVTKIVLSEEFQKENQLQELFVRGREFAQERPEFAIHRGAMRIYSPEPGFFDPDFVEFIEKIRSFIFSSVIAAFMGIRWLRRRREKRKAHRLDECMRRLLDIEQRHLSLPGNELRNLEKLLTEVSQLRQEALRKFSARELNEDRTVDCFLQMCIGVSNDISSRILRTQLDKRLDEFSRVPNEGDRSKWS